MNRPAPRRGEIWWTASEGTPPKRHPVVIVSLDVRNTNERIDTVLAVPFTSKITEGPTVVKLEPGESGLDQPSCIRGHYISTMRKSNLLERLPRALSSRRMQELCLAIRRSFDPNAFSDNLRG